MGTHRDHILGLSLLVLAALLPGASAATAQNLLLNPELDGFGTTDSSFHPFPEWVTKVVTPTAGTDADGCPASGSHRQDATSQGSGSINATCIQATPSETLHIDVSYRSSAPFEIRILQSPNLDCSEAAVPIPLPEPDIPASANWAIARDQVTLGPATTSVLLWLRSDGDGSYFFEFDRVYVGRAERIFADDFEGGGLFCRWTGYQTAEI